MKKIVQLVLTTLLVSFLLVGCTEEPGAALADGVIDLTFWRPAANEAEDQFYVDAVAEFNRLNEGSIHVHMEVIPRGDGFAYEDRINVAATSDSLPDILALDGPNVASYAFHGIIVPLNDFFTQAELSDFVPSIIQQGTFGGRLYALGATESTVILFYNRTLMNEAGITPPDTLENAWTWEEFYEVITTLATDDVFGTNLINDRGEWMTYAFQQFWISNGTNILSADGTTAEGYVNSPEGVEAAYFLQMLAAQNLFSVDPMPFEFEMGLSATRLSGPWIIADFANFDLDWGMTFFPYSKVQTSPSGSWCFGVSRNSNHPAEAAEFNRFLTSTENSITLARAINMPPSRVSAFEAMDEYATMPFRVIADQVVHTSNARPSTPNYPMLTQRFTEALLNIMLGYDVQENLDSVARDVDQNFEREYNR